MVKAHLVDNVISENESFTVAKGKYKGLTFYHDDYQCRATADIRYFGKFLVKFVIKVEKGLVHKNFNHLIEVTRFIQHWRPLANFCQEIIPKKSHALTSTMPVKHRKETDQFPLTSTDILFD